MLCNRERGAATTANSVLRIISLAVAVQPAGSGPVDHLHHTVQLGQWRAWARQHAHGRVDAVVLRALRPPRPARAMQATATGCDQTTTRRRRGRGKDRRELRSPVRELSASLTARACFDCFDCTAADRPVLHHQHQLRRWCPLGLSLAHGRRPRNTTHALRWGPPTTAHGRGLTDVAFVYRTPRDNSKSAHPSRGRRQRRRRRH